MHKATKAVAELDATPHEHEEAIMSLFSHTGSETTSTVQEARALGFSFQNILALMLQYGPQFVAVMQALFAALKTPVPTPALGVADVTHDEPASFRGRKPKTISETGE